MRYKAGDKVWVRCSNPEVSLFGIKAGVVGGPSDSYNRLCPEGGPWYLVEIPGHVSDFKEGWWAGRERNIWPRDEDGRRAGSWENSVTVWRPGRSTIGERWSDGQKKDRVG
jgi:hypothetical protein